MVLPGGNYNIVQKSVFLAVERLAKKRLNAISKKNNVFIRNGPLGD